jgi:hypothetical protein
LHEFASTVGDSHTFDATWTLASAIGADRLTLGLSGEAAPPVSGSGANIGIDPFNDQFNVLPGDVNGDGVVTIRDAILVHNEIASGSYLIWDDIDGNSVVNIADLNGVRKRLGTHLP